MTTRRLIVAGVCAVPVLIFGGVHLFAAQAPLPAPDTQKLVIDNAFVRVFDIRVPPGVMEARHSHPHGVTVALTDYDNETRVDGGRWVRSHTKAGEVKWAEPVTHEARNVGATEQHVIRIELK
jgi:hypothetical protein